MESASGGSSLIRNADGEDGQDLTVAQLPPLSSATSSHGDQISIGKGAEKTEDGKKGGEKMEPKSMPVMIYSAKCYAINTAVERLGWQHLQRVEENMPKDGKPTPTVRQCPRELSEWKPKAKRSKITGRTIAAIPSYKFRPWTICWVDLHEQTDDVLMGLQPHQKVNKVPGLCELVRKKRLGVNLTRLAKSLPEEYNFFPKTWVLPRDWNDLTREAYAHTRRRGRSSSSVASDVGSAAAVPSAAKAKQDDEKRIREHTTKSVATADAATSEQIYICKPVSGARGQGIWMTTDVNKIDLKTSQVVQTYINDPYLIHGTKFDMRVYALVTSNDPMRIYVYKEGIARFATEKYKPATPENLNTLFMHLTNYSINKKNTKARFTSSSSSTSSSSPAANKGKASGSQEKGGGNELGSKWPLTQLFKYMKEERNIDVELLWSTMKDVILKTFIAVAHPVQSRYRKLFPLDYTGGLCFELVGFDIMLDESLRAYVLEVNRNPSLNMETPFDRTLKGDVTTDTLRLVNPYPVDTSKCKHFQKVSATKYQQQDKRRPPKGLFAADQAKRTRHPRTYSSWAKVREAGRVAFRNNAKDYKEWQKKRADSARAIREAAEDALLPFTNYERIFPITRSQGLREDKDEKSSATKEDDNDGGDAYSRRIDKLVATSRQVWEALERNGIKSSSALGTSSLYGENAKSASRPFLPKSPARSRRSQKRTGGGGGPP